MIMNMNIYENLNEYEIFKIMHLVTNQNLGTTCCILIFNASEPELKGKTKEASNFILIFLGFAQSREKAIVSRLLMLE